MWSPDERTVIARWCREVAGALIHQWGPEPDKVLGDYMALIAGFLDEADRELDSDDEPERVERLEHLVRRMGRIAGFERDEDIWDSLSPDEQELYGEVVHGRTPEMPTPEMPKS